MHLPADKPEPQVLTLERRGSPRSAGENRSRECLPRSGIDGLMAAAHQYLWRTPPGWILVIEDELAVAADLTGIILEMGHKVVGVTATFEHALSVFRHEQPDLVLSDIQLADGSSGIRAIDIIRESRPKTPVVFVTGFPELLRDGGELTPGLVIQKPCTAGQVRSAVNRALYFT